MTELVSRTSSTRSDSQISREISGTCCSYTLADFQSNFRKLGAGPKGTKTCTPDYRDALHGPIRVGGLIENPKTLPPAPGSPEAKAAKNEAADKRAEAEEAKKPEAEKQAEAALKKD